MASSSLPSAGPRRWTRRVPLIGGSLLVLLIVLGLWPRALVVETGAVVRGPLQVTVDEEGRTRVRQSYVVSAPVAGTLRRIDLKPGAPVAAGRTVIAALETGGADLLDARSLALAESRVSAALAARDAAAAQRERARAAAALARADLERARTLFARGVLSQQEIDVAQTRDTAAQQDDRTAVFQHQIADFELAQARTWLMRGKPENASDASLELLAPVDGRVLRVFQESSRAVVPGAPLLEVGDATDLEVVIEVLSRDAVPVRPGAPVWLERWGGDAPLAARVRLVEPSGFTKISALGVEEQRVNVIADFVDPLEKRPTLGDAFRVEARIVTWQGADVLQVPAGALFQRGGRWQTFVVAGGRARLREVEVGRTNGLQTEVRAGLEPGEHVVVYPGDKVADGVRVRAAQ